MLASADTQSDGSSLGLIIGLCLIPVFFASIGFPLIYWCCCRSRDKGTAKHDMEVGMENVESKVKFPKKSHQNIYYGRNQMQKLESPNRMLPAEMVQMRNQRVYVAPVPSSQSKIQNMNQQSKFSTYNSGDGLYLPGNVQPVPPKLNYSNHDNSMTRPVINSSTFVPRRPNQFYTPSTYISRRSDTADLVDTSNISFSYDNYSYDQSFKYSNNFAG